MGQKAKGAKAKVTEAVYVRLTTAEYITICKGAEDAGLSVSRFLAQAGVDRSEGRPAGASIVMPPRFLRRGKTLRRLRANYDDRTREHDVLNWAIDVHRYMTTDAVARKKRPGPPPLDAEKHLHTVAAAHRERKRGPVLGALAWSERMASWLRSLLAEDERRSGGGG